MQLCDRCSDAIMQRYCMASHRIAACIASLHASLYCSAAHIAASLHVSHRCMRRFIAALLVSQHRCMYRSVPIMQRCDAIHSAQQTAVCTVHNRHCQSVVHWLHVSQRSNHAAMRCDSPCTTDCSVHCAQQTLPVCCALCATAVVHAVYCATAVVHTSDRNCCCAQYTACTTDCCYAHCA